MKANKTAAKNEKGNGMKSPPKSILRKKGKPAAPTQLPKKKSVKSNTPAQGGNNNATVCGSKKKKPKQHRVSFNGNKDGQCTNLYK